MGRVFRARDRASGETVAVKLMSEDHECHTERFEREIEVLAELTHPGIVRHVCHGVMASGAPFLVMEWLEGEDLKPSNLFLPGGIIEQVKVLDFGMARREGHASITRTDVMVGTLGYMAPEQVRAGGAIDARADVFALGCVLFLCLTGTPAFDGDSPASILGQILFGEPAPNRCTFEGGVRTLTTGRQLHQRLRRSVGSRAPWRRPS